MQLLFHPGFDLLWGADGKDMPQLASIEFEELSFFGTDSALVLSSRFLWMGFPVDLPSLAHFICKDSESFDKVVIRGTCWDWCVT